MNTNYIEENEAERQRLRDVASALTDDDFRQKLTSGLTVAAALVHLAFWDDHGLALLHGEQSELVRYGANVEAINAAIAHIAGAVQGDRAVQLALTAADAVDREIEGLDPEQVAAIEAQGNEHLLRRAPHRRLHLDQIEEALAKGTSRPHA